MVPSSEQISRTNHVQRSMTKDRRFLTFGSKRGRQYLSYLCPANVDGKIMSEECVILIRWTGVEKRSQSVGVAEQGVQPAHHLSQFTIVARKLLPI